MILPVPPPEHERVYVLVRWAVDPWALVVGVWWDGADAMQHAAEIEGRSLHWTWFGDAPEAWAAGGWEVLEVDLR